MLRALAFLTVFGRGAAPDGRTLRWFPVAGTLVGAVVGGAWWAADRVFDPVLAAALVVVVDLVVTGLLHVDGLGDSADGLLAPMDRERRLAVMRDPTTGAFGVVAVAAALLVRFAAFASLTALAAPRVDGADVVLVVVVWTVSRSLMAIVAANRPYARPDGLATSFLGDRLAAPLGVVGVLVAAVAAGVFVGASGVAAVGAAVAGAFTVVALADRRLGGFTGDVLGAAGVVAETLALVVAAARW